MPSLVGPSRNVAADFVPGSGDNLFPPRIESYSSRSATFPLLRTDLICPRQGKNHSHSELANQGDPGKRKATRCAEGRTGVCHSAWGIRTGVILSDSDSLSAAHHRLFPRYLHGPNRSESEWGSPTLVPEADVARRTNSSWPGHVLVACLRVIADEGHVVDIDAK